jgi:dolichyl-phosphate beta-glucosyltransferase
VSAPRLSVVIPAFNEAARLPATLAHLVAYLEASGPSPYELLLVDDGSRDATAACAQAAGGAVRVLRNPTNRGKGYSVRRGMLEARGERLLMSDADLSTPIEELPRLLQKLDEGFDVAIASRALPGANIEVRQGRFRESVGRLFNLLVRLLVLPGLNDTQCGFKLWQAAAAKEAFSLSRLDGFSFDVETLYVAARHGRRIAEIPVTWRNDTATRVTLLRGTQAFLDVLRIRLSGLLGRYEP